MGKSNKGKKSFGIAMLNWAGPDFWSVYASGYKRAAELLIEGEKDTYETNTVIFPILALYRHYIELSLKEVIAYGQYLEGKGTIPHSHDLKTLWGHAKKFLDKHCGFKKKEINRIAALVYDIHDLDPTSESSRYPYPFGKQKAKRKIVIKASFAGAPLFLNLDLLHEHIGELGEYLNQATTCLSILRDHETELRSMFKYEYL